MGRNQHVVPSRKGGWDVKAEGAARATKNLPTQVEAVEVAREIARNQKSELVVHNRHGRIRARDSYGRDPYPPKG